MTKLMRVLWAKVLQEIHKCQQHEEIIEDLRVQPRGPGKSAHLLRNGMGWKEN